MIERGQLVVEGSRPSRANPVLEQCVEILADFRRDRIVDRVSSLASISRRRRWRCSFTALNPGSRLAALPLAAAERSPDDQVSSIFAA